MKRNAILLSVIVSISQGVQSIIGFHLGAGKYDRVRQTYLLAIKWNFVVSAVLVYKEFKVLGKRQVGN